MKTELYKKIVKAAKIEAGDMVLVQYWMEENFSDDVAFLQAQIAAAGATPVMVVQNLKISQLINENVTPTTYTDKFFKLYDDADVIIDLMERPIGVLTKPLEGAKMGLLGAYMGRLFETCASKKKLLQLSVPTKTMAKKAGLSVSDYEERLEKAIDIDYEALKNDCEKKKATFEDKTDLTIKTGDGKYALSLNFEGREWKIDAGDGDIPCGEIYIAPVENKTNGQVFFGTIYLPDFENPNQKNKFENVVLNVENGVITSTNQKELDEFFKEADENNSTSGELGFGLNKGVSSLCGVEVLDEKMYGTFHLGIGENTMFGGENEADIHIDFVGNFEI